METLGWYQTTRAPGSDWPFPKPFRIVISDAGIIRDEWYADEEITQEQIDAMYGTHVPLRRVP